MCVSVCEPETRLAIAEIRPRDWIATKQGLKRRMRQGRGFDPPPNYNGDEGDGGDRCVCEQPGPYNCGVPGILAFVVDGTVPEHCQVERCDSCMRFPSDAAAEDELRKRGLFSVDDPRARWPRGPLQNYSVHCYATVRVKIPQIPARNPREAARRARDRFDWDRYASQAEFAADLPGFLVDCDGDDDFGRSVRFNPELEEVGP